MVERYDAEMRKHLRESFLAAEKNFCGKEKIGRELPHRSIYPINRSYRSRCFEFLKSIYERFEKCQWWDFLRLLVPIIRKKPFVFFLFTWWLILNDSKLQTRCEAVVKINIFLHGQVCHLVFRVSSAACGFLSPLSSEQQKFMFTR